MPALRRALAAALALLLAGALAVVAAGEVLSRAARHSVGAPPPELEAVDVRLPVAPAGVVAGWFARGTPGCGAVLLLHGVRGDRRQMLARARFLRAAGHAVLLIDLPAHGESSGERITFGAREGAGVAAALGWLRRTLPGERIGIVGVSLGAASTVLLRPSPAPDAVVLESMYPTIDDAVADRLALHVGAAGRLLAPLLLAQLPWRLGIDRAALRPIDALPALHTPLLVAAGTADRHTPWAETERLFAAATAEPKTLWPVAGAAHVDLHAFDPPGYEARVGAFLAGHLRAEAAAKRQFLALFGP